jgi:acetyl-CoA carboxylase biotin carboxyl carrier protein
VRFGGRLPPPPDPDLIRALARLLDETGLSEIEYAIGRHRLRVARRAEPVRDAARSAAAEAIADDAAVTGHPGALTAPMVGTVYLAPQPGAAAFVEIGDAVVAGQTLLIIEAMKVMNEIRAARPGRVTRILVADAEPVEYGAPLMLIE